jgi:hypothetical protein
VECTAAFPRSPTNESWGLDVPDSPTGPALPNADPDDNHLLAAAITGCARLIVSGDRQGMLALREVAGIAIVTARDAVVLLDRRCEE